MTDIKNQSSEIIIFKTADEKISVNVVMENETVWLTIEQMAILFGKSKSTINEHILNIYKEKELIKDQTLRKIGISDFSTKPTNYYNLDVIISVGYRVKSLRGTEFRKWATARLKEYIIKGFTMDDERLKGTGGGNYWKELLDRIRDIRSSEKVLYRQVLDLYATSIDYNPKSEESKTFFATVQNKLHYAVNKQTAAELIHDRVNAEKEFMGLTTFTGAIPVKKDIAIAKNYLEEEELQILNRLVSAFFELAELKAMEHKSMKMQDWIQELDTFTTSYGKGTLQNAGKISHEQAIEKAGKEYKQYQVKTLSPVEKEYLENMKNIEKTVLKKSKK
ncbi:MAG: virulence RhuM family protein [Candidatus Marinimicrobia bacterium]|nr:virulence RhuM family protein [Candidatus Neomarinimicrobiota bacterium]